MPRRSVTPCMHEGEGAFRMWVRDRYPSWLPSRGALPLPGPDHQPMFPAWPARQVPVWASAVVSDGRLLPFSNHVPPSISPMQPTLRRSLLVSPFARHLSLATCDWHFGWPSDVFRSSAGPKKPPFFQNSPSLFLRHLSSPSELRA